MVLVSACLSLSQLGVTGVTAGLMTAPRASSQCSLMHEDRALPERMIMRLFA
jgi:hypothetical protein